MTNSERAYRFLLSLYPHRFQTRFADEMAQVFQDCCAHEAGSGVGGPAGSKKGREATYRSDPAGGPDANKLLWLLWLRILRDSLLSIGREWRKEIFRDDSDIDYHGLVDSFTIAIVVGANLLGWGWMGATVILDLETPFWDSALVVIAGMVTFILAILVGILSAMVVARNGRRDRPRSITA